MTTKNLKSEFHEIFAKLMTGSRAEFKEAKKRINALWHASAVKKFVNGAKVALDYIPRFDEIKKTENQAAFASGLGLFYLALADEHFQIFKDFTLKLLQHPHGHVRESVRHSAEWLYCSLSQRVDPFLYPKGKMLTEKQKIEQAEARKQYIALVEELEKLIDKYNDGGNEDVEYIDQMKPSVNKSLQQFWSRLTEMHAYQQVLEQTRPIPIEVYARRKEIENALIEMLIENKSDFELGDIKEIIYDEDGQDSLTEIIAMFDHGGGSGELSDILELVTDAWNYFPHKSLNGLSPAEKSLEYYGNV